jgi:hypothetical protein
LSVAVSIREFAILTTTGRHGYTFRDGLNAIVGPVGTGKSSLLELIRYTLGGDGVITSAVNRAVRASQVTVQFGPETRIFRRQLHASQIRVYDEDREIVETLSVSKSVNYRRASDYLLEQLDIPKAHVLRARVRLTGATSELSFYDYYPYMYLSQTEIDRSVAYHTDSIRDPKRRAAFEVLLGIADVDVFQVETRVAELKDELARARSDQAAISTFLQQSQFEPEAELVRHRKRLLEEIASATLRLQDLRETARAATLEEAPLRQSLASTSARLGGLRERQRAIETELADRARVVAQLGIDLERVDRGESATALLLSLDFLRCPRCGQSVDATRTSEDNCYLCLQPISVERADTPSTSVERRRLEAVKAEVSDLAAHAEQELTTVVEEARSTEFQVTALERAIDTRTRGYVSALFEEVAEVTSNIAKAESEQSSVERALSVWAAYESRRADVLRLESELGAVEARLAELREELSARRRRVEEISELFDETIRFFELPWYESARIDPQTYLPIVNGTGFRELSSGGMKTAVNVAYHIALLTYALRQGTTRLPYFLIIDSPRKNLGSSGEDVAMANRMYRRLKALVDTYGSRLQLILADNDTLRIETPLNNVISLSYDRPFVPDLAHPGPENVVTIGSDK